METPQARSILTVALMAAYADGLKDEREREALGGLAQSLGREQQDLDLPALYREVLLSKPDLAAVVAPLATPELRNYAYEMAVAVANADGAQVPAEAEFLAQLANALGLPQASAAATADAASAVAEAAFDPPAREPTRRTTPPLAGAVLGKASVGDAEIDGIIVNAAVTNAALELLPETLASMAIIPLQMRLVYRIGRAYGYEMDQTHAKDFIATLGVGLTSQYVEQLGRKVLGGLLGGVAGGLGRTLGRQAASSGLTFATTYAIGRVAQRYYAGGRTLGAAALKQTFTSMLAEARGLAPRYQAQVEQMAPTIDTRSLVSLVRET